MRKLWRRLRVASVVAVAAVGVIALAGVFGAGASGKPRLGSRGIRGLPAGGVRAARVARSRSSWDLGNFTPIGSSTVWATASGTGSRDAPQAVLRTSDGGARWSDVTPPGLHRATAAREVYSIDFVTSTRAWLSYGPPDHPALLRSSDGGQRWTRAGSTPADCQIQFVNRLDGWCVANPGRPGHEGTVINQTTNGGQSWREVSHNVGAGPASTDPLPQSCDWSVSFTSPKVGFAGGGLCRRPSIYSTADGGARWHRRLRLHGLATFTEVVGNARNEAMGVDDLLGSAFFYRSSDGGTRWTRVNPPGPSDDGVLGADVVTARVWKDQVAGNILLATDNAGRSWTRTTADVTLNTTDQLQFSTALVGWDQQIDESIHDVLHTTDGGRLWTTVHVPR
jgi:photosystem II stability/assembly factor-like uncharacterized protein